MKKMREIQAITDLALSKDEDALSEACDGGYSWANAGEDDSWEAGQCRAACFDGGFKVAIKATTEKKDIFKVVSEYDCWVFVGSKKEVIKRLKALPDKEKDEDEDNPDSDSP